MGALEGTRQGEHALVIGNSPWRIGYPLETWVAGPTIGCNAIYRDSPSGEPGFYPDFLCAVDLRMVRELIEADVAGKTNLVLSVHADMVCRKGGPWYVAKDRMWKTTTGGMAITLAGYLGCTTVSLLGFSADGTNLYVGTPHYKDKTQPQSKEPGSVNSVLEKINGAVEKYKQMVPDGRVFFVSTFEWALGKLVRPGR